MRYNETLFISLLNRFINYVGSKAPHCEEANWHALANDLDLSMYCAFLFVTLGVKAATILTVLDAVQIGLKYATRIKGNILVLAFAIAWTVTY